VARPGSPGEMVIETERDWFLIWLLFQLCVSCACLWHRIPDIYVHFRESVDQSDAVTDLKWWSDIYGASMTMAWPQYEVNAEYHNVL